MKYNIDSLVIEITRKCNMKCPHCLRGPAQNKEIDGRYIDTLFKNVNYVSTITFTGGEPSLAPHKIRETIELAKKNGVEFGNFYIATNGKNVTPDFFMSVAELYVFCTDNETSGIAISTDRFHEKVNRHSILEAFKFFDEKGEILSQYVINEGAAKTNHIGRVKRDPAAYYIDEQDEETIYIGEGVIYLNCDGNLVAGCDFSYKSQKKQSLIISAVEDFSVEKLQPFLN